MLPKIICTPSHGPLAMIVDMATGAIAQMIAMPDAFHGKRHRPFGIARNPHGGWYISDYDAIAFLNEDFALTDSILGLPDNLHQIQFDSISGKLWVMATTIDALLSIDIHTKDIQRFCLLTDRWLPMDAPGIEKHHFNSLYWTAEHCYVVAHNYGRSASVIRTYNRAMKRMGIWHAGMESHSVTPHEGALYIVDSRGGRIIGNNGRQFSICEVPQHYARGMAITPEGIAIIAAFDFGDASTRESGDAFLRAFDLKNGLMIREIRLQGTGNIQDIQLYHTRTGD